MKSSRGFTWLEVLIVVAVLAILCALLFPNVSGPGPGSARRASAKNDTVQIATAIAAYQTEYGSLPTTNGQVQNVGGSILQALMGSNSTLNRRMIVFLEVQTARRGKGGIRDGTYVDPWGSPYKMKLDTDGDRQIIDAGTNSSTKVIKTVAVWNEPSTHPDHPKAIDIKRRSVTSWE
jgi:prepilin-type N-terminal cleavage/methylation domain-containing protein